MTQDKRAYWIEFLSSGSGGSWSLTADQAKEVASLLGSPASDGLARLRSAISLLGCEGDRFVERRHVLAEIDRLALRSPSPASSDAASEAEIRAWRNGAMRVQPDHEHADPSNSERLRVVTIDEIDAAVALMRRATSQPDGGEDATIIAAYRRQADAEIAALRQERDTLAKDLAERTRAASSERTAMIEQNRAEAAKHMRVCERTINDLRAENATLKQQQTATPLAAGGDGVLREAAKAFDVWVRNELGDGCTIEARASWWPGFGARVDAIRAALAQPPAPVEPAPVASKNDMPRLVTLAKKAQETLQRVCEKQAGMVEFDGGCAWLSDRGPVLGDLIHAVLDAEYVEPAPVAGGGKRNWIAEIARWVRGNCDLTEEGEREFAALIVGAESAPPSLRHALLQASEAELRALLGDDEFDRTAAHGRAIAAKALAATPQPPASEPRGEAKVPRVVWQGKVKTEHKNGDDCVWRVVVGKETYNAERFDHSDALGTERWSTYAPGYSGVETTRAVAHALALLPEWREPLHGRVDGGSGGGDRG